MQPKQLSEASLLRRVWRFVWHDDSFESWLVNLALAVLIVKFIVYPLLGLILGTQYPVVAVVSGSMEHQGSFEQWWSTQQCPTMFGATSQSTWYTTRNVSEEQFKQFPFTNGFDKGDVMVLQSATNVKLGDILVFEAPGYNYPIIHRVVATDDKLFKTKGDFNCGQHDFEQQGVGKEKLLGKGLFRIPLLGWIKVWFVQLLQYITSFVRG